MERLVLKRVVAGILFVVFMFSFVSVSYAKNILAYKKELNLTPAQVAKIRNALSKLNKKVTLLKAKLIVANADLQKLLKNKADVSVIDKKLRDIFDYRREMIISYLIASRVIEKTLNKKQLEKWRKIQEENRNRNKKRK